MIIRTVKSGPDSWQLSFSGRLNTDSAPYARLVLREIPEGIGTIVLDFSGLEELTLAGMRELVMLRKRFPDAVIRLENLCRHVRQALKSSGFDGFFTLTEAEKAPHYLHMSLRDFLAEKSRKKGGETAVVTREGRHTWREIDECAGALAAELARQGVRKGSHVAICGRNSINWVCTFYAVQKLGAVAALINPGLKATEIAAVACGGDADILCYGEIAEMKDESIFLAEIEEASGGRLKRFCSIRSGRDLRAGAESASCCPDVDIEPDDPALMFFTSGYTGTPKGVLLSSFGLLNASMGSAGNQRLTDRDRICLILPLFHIFGLVAGLIAGACAGATVYIPANIRTDTILDLIDREKCTVFHSVPSMLIALINNSSFTREKLASLRCTIISAAAATHRQMERFQEAMPRNHFLSSYGLSEMAPVSITEYEDTSEHVMFTVGKPWPDIQLKIVDRTTGEDCPQGKDGEILVQGFSLMGGYYKIDIDAQNIDAEGWLHTGDRGYLDEDGYLRLMGRYKELILRGGENVMPGEIEYVLTELDCVAAAKVIGVPSEFFGEEVCACLVCRPGMKFDEKEAKDYLSERLARFKVPSFFLVFDELPLLGSGKIDLAALKKTALERLGTDRK